MRTSRFLLIWAAVFTTCTIAQGAYILTPLWWDGSNWKDEIEINLGGSEAARTFDLDFVLTSDASDQHDSIAFDAVFSDGGLTYNSYAWGGSHSLRFADGSIPVLEDLAVTISDSTYEAAGSPVDVHFENFTTTPFTVGTVVSMSITVPSGFDFGPDEKTVVSLMIVGIRDGTDDVPVTSGGDFTIIPEPATLMLIAVGVPLLLRRKRS